MGLSFNIFTGILPTYRKWKIDHATRRFHYITSLLFMWACFEAKTLLWINFSVTYHKSLPSCSKYWQRLTVRFIRWSECKGKIFNPILFIIIGSIESRQYAHVDFTETTLCIHTLSYIIKLKRYGTKKDKIDWRNHYINMILQV